ncbi:AraC family transcriptional regulator [Paenibacillus agaridevorans]|uniref:AraC family transcriptional regulator n=1 Tax=Paenibacillus agaridevorans TaxID=171404 RepID=A0A2R5EH41_9BACL|nr:helix-turn-helix transcriptional regulator [Paenibacillus agaridevorans]GBG05886.1 AraC family transcriptional regulator [Paenibacillus agaridevorans]
MDYFSINGLSRLDVKWSRLYNIDPNFLIPRANPHYELIMVADSPVFIQVGQEKYTLNGGDCLLLLPWEEHFAWKPGGGSFFWVQFSSDPSLELIDAGDNLTSLLKICHTSSNFLRTSTNEHAGKLIIPRLYTPSRRYECLHTFEIMINEFNKPKGYYHYRLNRCLAKLIEISAEDLLDKVMSDINLPASIITYQRLVEILNESYMLECTAASIERMLDRKYEYLCNIFKKYSGITINLYLQQLRIQRAKYLLRETEKSVQDIAFELSFENPLYFSKTFKKLEGLSPSHYRDKFQTLLSAGNPSLTKATAPNLY